MYLVDTNIFLELLLEQEKSRDARKFLSSASTYEVLITDLSLHSIGIILLRLKKRDLFINFIKDLMDGNVKVLSLDLKDQITVAEIAEKFGLDFDDSYQYAISEKYDLQIVSFDRDFDRTGRGRKEPSELMLAPEKE